MTFGKLCFLSLREMIKSFFFPPLSSDLAKEIGLTALKLRRGSLSCIPPKGCSGGQSQVHPQTSPRDTDPVMMARVWLEGDNMG